ncbi:hypothetical protein LTW04_24985 [Escherichia coli]|uniref:hypothetical protein n=1 Tax=Enterobacteriaceae TaxID=543 RepID=UPI001D18104C|nr:MULTISPECIES: hypothetical protein [Enterobacteriaceae]MCD6946298.1 hypothetical protein [Escherichia coli]MCD6966061.1 hypothetical protein [Escherichia coli]
MKEHYLEGNNISMVVEVCIFLFLIGVICILSVFLLYRKIKMRVNVDYLLAFGVIIALASIVSAVMFTSRSLTMEDLELGRHWKQDCKLLEVNIPTGTFTDPVNRLGCSDVIVNVPTNQYDEYIRQWDLYKVKN